MADRLPLSLPDWAEGVLVVGDVHGQAALFGAMIELAGRERRFLVSLGDLTDRGPDNDGALRLMLGLLENKAGLFIRGNHDDKLYRTLSGNPTIVDSDLAFTLEQLDAAADGKALKSAFKAAYRAAPYLVTLGQSVLVHGALAPAMLTSRSLPAKLRALALYGEAHRDPTKKKPIRTYRWLAKVPPGTTVVIGHHPLSDTTLLTREGAHGARLIHLDCGAGKGRGLGALRLDRAGRVATACLATKCADGVRIAAIGFAVAQDIASAEMIG